MVLREDPEHQEHQKLLMRVVRKYFGEHLRDKFTSLHQEAERRRVAYHEARHTVQVYSTVYRCTVQYRVAYHEARHTGFSGSPIFSSK